MDWPFVRGFSGWLQPPNGGLENHARQPDWNVWRAALIGVVFTLRLKRRPPPCWIKTHWHLWPPPPLSRAMMPLVMAALPNARRDGLSRSVGGPREQTVTIKFGNCAGGLRCFAWAAVGVTALLVALASECRVAALAQGQDRRNRPADLCWVAPTAGEAAVSLLT